MFGNMTYENILNDMLSRVTSNVDKIEGSIIYDALAPTAYKLAETYFLLSNLIDLVFIDTSTGEYLDRACKPYGVERKQATKALRKIKTDSIINIGNRFAFKDTSYIVVEKISDFEYIAECEQLGEVGNIFSGTLENIDNIQVTANLDEVITRGAEIETDDNLRARLYHKVQLPSTSGNIYDYLNWALEIEGVGNAKVIPLWNGSGTVKVLIVDSNMEIDTSLEDEVYNHIEKLRPVGAEVTVVSPSSLNINVSANITLDGSKTLEEVTEGFKKHLAEHLKEIIFKNYYISYAKVGSLLLSTAGVRDYANLFVNEGTNNISVNIDEMPTVSSVVLSEV